MIPAGWKHSSLGDVLPTGCATRLQQASDENFFFEAKKERRVPHRCKSIEPSSVKFGEVNRGRLLGTTPGRAFMCLVAS